MNYSEFSFEERSFIQIGLSEGLSRRAIGRQLKRSHTAVIREINRNSPDGVYQACKAQKLRNQRRQPCRPKKKLSADSELFQLIIDMLRRYFSPEQISGYLKEQMKLFPEQYVCRETIYNAIYALPVGELKKELIHCLRHGRSTRKPRRGSVDRRGQIPDMVSIHLRPPEVDDRTVPGHWEGDLIKGKNNASAVGTLVELTTGYVILARMTDATATSAVSGFSAALNRMPDRMKKSMTYDQGREMAKHAEITQKTGVAIYFADPHSPWQRGANENINGLIRQYLPKGMDLSEVTQEELDKIAYSLNIRPRKRFNFKCPIQMMTEKLELISEAPGQLQ